MHIEELKGGEVEGGKEEKIDVGNDDIGGATFVVSDAKRALVGAGARALFYPTLLYNVVRNKIQVEFRWWDKVDEVWFCKLRICSCLCDIRLLLAGGNLFWTTHELPLLASR